jgi:hypothetical protein
MSASNKSSKKTFTKRAMTNIQVSIDDRLLAEIRQAGKSVGQDVAQIVREALAAWLKRREGARFEQEWIASLKKNPDEANRAEEWLEAQAWTAP